MKNTMRQMIKQMTAHPERLIPMYKEAYPGITDDDARILALAFTGLLKGGAGIEERQKEYGKTLAEMEKKYPGGEFPTLDLNIPELDLDIPTLDFDI